MFLSSLIGTVSQLCNFFIRVWDTLFCQLASPTRLSSMGSESAFYLFPALTPKPDSKWASEKWMTEWCKTSWDNLAGELVYSGFYFYENELGYISKECVWRTHPDSGWQVCQQLNFPGMSETMKCLRLQGGWVTYSWVCTSSWAGKWKEMPKTLSESPGGYSVEFSGPVLVRLPHQLLPLELTKLRHPLGAM